MATIGIKWLKSTKPHRGFQVILTQCVYAIIESPSLKEARKDCSLSVCSARASNSNAKSGAKFVRWENVFDESWDWTAWGCDFEVTVSRNAIQIKSNQIYLTKGPQGHLHCNTSNIQ